MHFSALSGVHQCSIVAVQQRSIVPAKFRVSRENLHVALVPYPASCSHDMLGSLESYARLRTGGCGVGQDSNDGSMLSTRRPLAVVQAPTLRRYSWGDSGHRIAPSRARSAPSNRAQSSSSYAHQVAGSTGKPATSKKYSRIAGGPGSSLAAKFVPTEADSSRSNNDGSPIRTQTQTAEGRDRAGEESHIEDDAHVGMGRRDARPRSKKEEVFHRLQSHLTESEWRRQAESKAATTGRLSVSRRVSHDVRDGVLPAAVSSAALAADAGAGGGATPVPALPSIASRRSPDLDTSSGSSRADDHGMR